MEEMSFEMARDLGLIPYPTQRINEQYLFESYQGFKDRLDRQELGYRAEQERIVRKYQTVEFRGKTYQVV